LMAFPRLMSMSFVGVYSVPLVSTNVPQFLEQNKLGGNRRTLGMQRLRHYPRTTCANFRTAKVSLVISNLQYGHKFWQ
jgi:hypothetical protein